MSIAKSRTQRNELVIALVSHVRFVSYITLNVSFTHIFSKNLIVFPCMVAKLPTLDRLFKTFIFQRFGRCWSFINLTVVHCSDLLKQEGGVECDGFLLHFMRCLSDGIDEHSQVE